LPSFVVFRMPKQELSPQQIVDKTSSLSIFSNTSTVKEGVLPADTEHVGSSVYMSFGFEYVLEYNTLEGKKEDKALGDVPVIFLNERFLAIGAVPEDVESKVRKFIQDNFVKEFELEQIEFNEPTLRKILRSSPDVFQIDHTPTRPGLETVDRITYVGRGVTDSRIHEDYGSEPLAKIKVRLGEIQSEARVGFDKRGIITIYQRGFTRAQQTIILRYIVEQIIAPYLSQAFFQRRLA